MIQFDVIALGLCLSAEWNKDLYTLRADVSSDARLKLELTSLVAFFVNAATDDPDLSLLADGLLTGCSLVSLWLIDVPRLDIGSSFSPC